MSVALSYPVNIPDSRVSVVTASPAELAAAAASWRTVEHLIALDIAAYSQRRELRSAA